MSTPVIYNGVTYNVPSFGDTGYAQGGGNMSAYWIALATGSLTRAGGSFTLTNDANFGPTFGLLSNYFTSVTPNAATAGTLRLAVTNTIDWRNNANSANLALGINGSDALTFNGTALAPVGNYITALTGDGTATGPGSVPLTLATVNSDVGSFTNANITVNAKGLITAASNGSSGGGGVTAVHSDSNPDITGDVQLVSGTNVTLSQSGQAITINASGGGSGITQLTGEVTAGPGSGSQAATVTNSAVIAKVLTGFTSGSGTVTSSDSILSALEKINANQGLNIPKTASLPSSGTTTPDASTASTFISATLTGTLTVNGPTNGVDGQKITFRFSQPIVGGPFAVTLDTAGSNHFRFSSSIPSYTNSSAIDYVGAIWNAATGHWDVVAVTLGTGF